MAIVTARAIQHGRIDQTTGTVTINSLHCLSSSPSATWRLDPCCGTAPRAAFLGSRRHRPRHGADAAQVDAAAHGSGTSPDVTMVKGDGRVTYGFSPLIALAGCWYSRFRAGPSVRKTQFPPVQPGLLRFLQESRTLRSNVFPDWGVPLDPKSRAARPRTGYGTCIPQINMKERCRLQC
jgi:hypothetical protein